MDSVDEATEPLDCGSVPLRDVPHCQPPVEDTHGTDLRVQWRDRCYDPPTVMHDDARGPAMTPPFPWSSFVRAAALHTGGSAATVSLRNDIVETGLASAETFDEAFAASRLTPGTNILAMYVLLGSHFGGWRGVARALAIGALIPAVIACAMSAVYVRYAWHPLAAAGMKGARAGALAVLVWAAVGLLRPQLARHGRRASLLTAGVVFIVLLVPVPPLAALLAGGAVGAVLLGDAR